MLNDVELIISDGILVSGFLSKDTLASKKKNNLI